MIEINLVKDADLDICEKILAQPELLGFHGHYVSKGWLEDLKKDNLSFTISCDSKIVGCTFGEKLRRNGYFVWVIAIDPEYQNRGLGSKLLNYLEAKCKESDIHWMILYSTTNSEFNRQFYTSHGYMNKNGSFYEFGKDF